MLTMPPAEATPTGSAARLSGLLGDQDNLRVFAAVALGAETVAEVLATTALDPDAVQRSLARLVDGGLVRGAPSLQVDLGTLRAAARRRAPQLQGATPEQAAVLRNFIDEHGRLIELPARAGRRRVVLEYLAELFEPGRDYDEREVNEILGALHEDYATLRRCLVDERFLGRAAGVYQRVTSTSS